MSPAADSAASKRQAELLKQEGNAFFKKDRISAAIDAYTGVRFPPWHRPRDSCRPNSSNQPTFGPFRPPRYISMLYSKFRESL
jgi:hypothetical protein